MAFDNEALETKRKELEDLARQAISRFRWARSSTADSAVASAVQAFRLTPPTKPEKRVSLAAPSLTIPTSGRGRGRSRKPGNISIHWKKFIEIVPEVMVAAIGAGAAPYWAWPFIGLYILNKLWRGAEEDLSEAEATIIYALWKHRNGKNEISDDNGYTRTNSIRNQHNKPVLSRSEYDAGINHLLQMRCIEIKEGMIRLRERVRIEY
jgi:hypothetical protein